MVNYKIRKTAKLDLRRIYRHGKKEFGLVQADKYYKSFFKRFEEIAQNPYLYQSADYISSGYRRSVCGVDSIFYRVVDGAVEIIAIVGQQDTKNIIE